jgi:Fur family peroxide stress response transcriptional regulator
MMNELVQKLKEQGVVLTIQRMAVLECLLTECTHPTVEELHTALKKKFPTISLATIYNTLEMLKQAGVVRELNLGKEKRFDPVDESHHHFYCRECKKILDIGVACKFAEMKWVDNHKVESVQGIFYGVCSNCLKNEEKK